MFGTDLDIVTQVRIVKDSNSTSCVQAKSDMIVTTFDDPISEKKNEKRFKFIFPEDRYYFCFQYISPSTNNTLTPVFQNALTRLEATYKARTYYMPLPVQVISLIVLLMLSGLFSGLNLGLMALDPTELELIQNSGNKSERQNATTIMPVRKSGNYLLCSLLLGNVIVNSSISILFDDLTSGLIALVISSLGIVVFGEILPQSICNKQGLAVGAKTIWITKFFMVVTAPLAWPISKLLDLILGQEAGRVYDKDRLMELIRMSAQQQSDVAEAEEFKIVTGALQFNTKTVSDIMTNIEDVFMLPSDTTLNMKMVADVVQNGYTRIPVFEKERNNIVALLNVKDLALLDPDDNLTVKTVCGYWNHSLRFVMEDTPLKVMLEEFKKGHYHLAFVQTIEQPTEGDPFYRLIGIVTLEDVLEEIIQAEIMDETDVITDNVAKKRRKDVQLKDLSRILQQETTTAGSMSMQLQLAAVQWLSSNVRAFKDDLISGSVLQRLIRRDCRCERPSKTIDVDLMESLHSKAITKYVFKKGDPTDKFVLILEGRLEVTIGKENLMFEAGPFQCFGDEVMNTIADLCPIIVSGGNYDKHSMSFVPDFTAIARQDVIYVEITAREYFQAYRASLVESGKPLPMSMTSTLSSPMSTRDAETISNMPSQTSKCDPNRASTGHLTNRWSKWQADSNAPGQVSSPERLSIEDLSLHRGGPRATISSPKEAHKLLRRFLKGSGRDGDARYSAVGNTEARPTSADSVIRRDHTSNPSSCFRAGPPPLTSSGSMHATKSDGWKGNEVGTAAGAADVEMDVLEVKSQPIDANRKISETNEDSELESPSSQKKLLVRMKDITGGSKEDSL